MQQWVHLNSMNADERITAHTTLQLHLFIDIIFIRFIIIFSFFGRCISSKFKYKTCVHTEQQIIFDRLENVFRKSNEPSLSVNFFRGAILLNTNKLEEFRILRNLRQQKFFV